MTTRLFTTPNLCSVFRLAMSPILVMLAYGDERALFVAGFGAALVSDVADGLLARRLRIESEGGARLDSWSDLAMYLTASAGVCMLVPHIVRREAIMLAAMGVGYAVPILYGFLKFRRLTSYHAWSAKLSAVLVACAILAMLLFEQTWPLWIAGPVFLASSVEEIGITATLPQWRANVLSMWHARRLRKAGLRPPNAARTNAGPGPAATGRSEP
ncbi:MAG: CDP-alcohol phosphatidyltransferase family protein [Verrucomicrobiota bacterium]|nr:CDP-alcohol phosphatidyltransferase family protein [Verrucomicrobiota bacterium]